MPAAARHKPYFHLQVATETATHPYHISAMSSSSSKDTGAAARTSDSKMPIKYAEPEKPKEPEYPTSYWEDRLVGKRLVSDSEASDGDDTVCLPSITPLLIKLI